MAKTKIIEDSLYTGGKSGSGPDGLGPGDPPQSTPDPASEHAKGYDNIVPDARRSGDRHGVNPNFDVSEPRKKPALGGGNGSNTERSPFSAAGKNFNKD